MAQELMPLTVGSLFAGIGGFDLGLERAGMHIRWQVEIDPYCQRVLAKHWPAVKRYGDIKAIDWSRVEPVDVICGGFPCQPFSVAGKRKGKEDDRYLWPDMLKAITQVRPTWVIAENVPSIVGAVIDEMLVNLETIGYSARPLIVPACAVDAPHQRDRVWVVAYSDCKRLEGVHDERDGECVQLPQATWKEWEAEPRVDRVALGVPDRVDRLRGLGNAVVPQIVEWIGRHIIRVAE